MDKLLIIESTGFNCSVALCTTTGELLAEREERNLDQYIHTEKLHGFIENLVNQADVERSSIKGIGVSQGPGSYTGLRYGVSAAKGLCVAWNVPLIALNPFRAMWCMYADTLADKPQTLSAMLDARRQEVFMQNFDAEGLEISTVEAKIITQPTDVATKVWIGEGAEKFAHAEWLDDSVEIIPNIFPSAKYHIQEATSKWNAGKTENLAYFVPFYLKDFIATTPKTKFSIKGISKIG